MPNQDAFATWTDPETPRSRAIVAVADGHGGARHFRSAVGAALAVETAVVVLREADSLWQATTTSDRVLAAADLPEMLVDGWRSRVQSHLRRQPIRENEWRELAEVVGEMGAASVHADPILAYGSTLLAAVVGSDLVVVLQIGDGDILAVAPDGSASRPLPPDERLAAHRTTSLCQPDAAGTFRVRVLQPHEAAVALLLLSTDGYSTSFATDADFLKIGPDFLTMIERHGLQEISKSLDGILLDVSENGSGDDVTLALLHYQRAVMELALVPARSPEVWGD